MDYLFHHRISYRTLKKEWEKFYNIPFPDVPKDERLRDLFADLVLIDTETAGIVSSYLINKRVDKKLLTINNEFNSRINSFIPDDALQEKELSVIKYRKDMLDRLLNMIIYIENNK